MTRRSTIAIARMLPPWNLLRRPIDTYDHFFGALRYLRDRSDWDVSVLGMQLTTVQTLHQIDDIRRGRIAGVITDGQRNPLFPWCLKEGIPVVAMNRYLTSPQIPTVIHDDVAIGRLAAQYLVRRGFRSLAFSGPDYVSIRTEPLKKLMPYAEKRLQGFTEAAETLGATCSVFLNREAAALDAPENVCTNLYWRDLRHWIRNLPRPAGILACTDVWAMDCLRTCREEGLRVPQDIAVLGVDNDGICCEVSRPSLSSVDRNMFRIGYEAAALLVNFLNTRKWPSLPAMVPPAGVVERLSTDAVAVANPRLAAALRFVRARFCDPISLSDIARAVGVSESWLKHTFSREVGFSLVSEIRRLRLEKACDLLSGSHLPLKTIAQAAGFRGETQLCRVFAKEIGVSPRAWSESSHQMRAAKSA